MFGFFDSKTYTPLSLRIAGNSLVYMAVCGVVYGVLLNFRERYDPLATRFTSAQLFEIWGIFQGSPACDLRHLPRRALQRRRCAIFFLHPQESTCPRGRVLTFSSTSCSRDRAPSGGSAVCGKLRSLCRRGKVYGFDGEAQQLGDDGDVDEDVRAEANRVVTGSADNDVVKVGVFVLAFSSPHPALPTGWPAKLFSASS